MTHFSPERRGSSFHHLIHSAVSWLVLVLSILLGIAGAGAAFFGAAFFLNTSSSLLVVAILVGFLLTSGEPGSQLGW